ncbi:MAG: M1 family metallopeptidase [Flavobacteriales bacterium]
MKHLLCAALLACTVLAHAQDYFQQDVAYTIHVSLNDQDHTLSGDLELQYTNNSPDALDHIEMHLWPNAYKNGKTALAKQSYRSGDLFMFYAISKKLGYIDSLDFHVNGDQAQWSYDPEHIDIAYVQLAQPLAPGETLTLTTPFFVKLPTAKISRLGHVSQSYLITQWYPKPAVYDRNGWNAMPYLSKGEFYSEYGSFDVHVTLPANYVVGATGDLVDCPGEEAWLDQKAAETAEMTEFPEDMEFPPSASTTKTLHYHQENVHDFAWFADKRWHVLKGEVELPNTGRKVTTWAMFTNAGADLWKNSIEYLNDATYYYSLWNGDYPYNHVTAVDGTISAGAGMEYPNITVVNAMGNAQSLETVIVHEVGHNWFYGILGSNERTNAWMDEGINSYNETRYFRTKYGDSLHLASGATPDDLSEKLGLTRYSYKSRDELAWLLTARNYRDQPMQCHSNSFTDINYGTVVYKKSAAAMDHLAGYLGQDTFDRAMQTYFNQWKYRHPSPADLQAVLEAETGKDLNWWFQDLVQTDGKPDYALKFAKSSNTQTDLRVKNVGDIPAPYQLSGFVNGKLEWEQWFEGICAGADTAITLEVANLDEIRIDGREQMLEFNRQDNYGRGHGLMRRVEPLRLRPGTYLDDPAFTQVFWLPTLAWNEQDKFMAGLLLHNATLPARRLQWWAQPMYAFGAERVTGLGGFSYVTGRGILEGELRRFTDQVVDGEVLDIDESYLRSGLKYTLRPPVDPLANWNTRTGVELVHLMETRQREGIDPEGNVSEAQQVEHIVSPRIFITFEQVRPRLKQGYRFQVRNTFDPTAADQALALSATFLHKGSFQYNEEGRDLHWGLFAGAVSNTGRATMPLTGFGVTGTLDPLRDRLLLQRMGGNELLSRQTSNDQANFGYPIVAGEYLVNAYAELEVPVRLPVSFFASAYMYDLKDEMETDIIAGVSFPIFRDLFEIHVPLWGDELFGDTYNVAETITFELHLERLSPFRALRSLAM